MSKSVDERVVEMQFNNANFEKNIKQSTESLNKFKKELEFKDSSKSLKDIQNAANSVKFDGMASGIEQIKVKFSLLSAAAVSALNTIVSAATNAGLKLVKSLSLDQVTSGWNKYAEMTTSIQTIMGATANKIGSQFKDVDDQMDYVTSKMEELNWFSDETSYSFTDMANNIGKFTSNGVELDHAVTSMQGIATWAAAAGQNAQTASRVMYNMSQAIGAGGMKLIDWKSIELANMGTSEFKEAAIQAGLAYGKLSKNKKGQIIAGNGKKAKQVNEQTFRETLATGWFDNKVIDSVLQQYGNFSTQMQSIVNEKYGATASEFLQYISKFKEGTIDLDELAARFGATSEELNRDFLRLTTTSKLDEFANNYNLSIEKAAEYYERYKNDASEAGAIAKELGIKGKKDTNKFIDYLSRVAMYDQALGEKAFRAAQEAKTFKDAIDATTDAVSSGWMRIFQTIFGNYLEAKKLWTGLAEALYTIFAEPLAVIEGHLTPIFNKFREFKGVEAVIDIMTTLAEAIAEVKKNIIDAFADTFLTKSGAYLSKLARDAKKAIGDFVNSEKFSNAVDNIKRSAKGLFSVFKLIFDVIGKLIGTGASLSGNILFNPGGLLDLAGKLGTFLDKLTKIVDKSQLLQNIIDKIGELFNAIIGGIISGLDEVFGKVDDSEVDKKLSGVESALTNISEKIKNFKIPPEVSEFIKTGIVFVFNAIKAAWPYISKALTTLSGWLKTAGQYIGPIVKDLLGKISKLASDLSAKLSPVLSTVWKKLKGIFGEFDSKSGKFKLFDFSQIGKNIGDFFVKIYDTVAGWFKWLKDKIVALFNKDDAKGPTNAMDAWAQKITKSKKVSDLNAVLGFFTPWAEILKKVWNTITNLVTYIVNQMDLLSKQDPKKLLALVVIAATLITVLSLVSRSISTGEKLVKSIDKVAATFKDIGSSFKELSNGFNQYGKAAKWEAIKGAILQITILIGAIATLVIALGFIPSDNLKQGIAVTALIVAVVIGILVTMAAVNSKISDNWKETAASWLSVSVFLIAITTTLSKIVKSIQTIGKMDLKELLKGGGVVAVIIGSIVAIAFISAKKDLTGVQSSLEKAATGIRKISVSIMIISVASVALAAALAIIGLIPIYLLAKGTIVMITIMAAIAIISKAMSKIDSGDFKKRFMKMTLSLLIIAGALSLMSAFGLKDFNSIMGVLNGLAAALLYLLVALGVLLLLNNKFGNMEAVEQAANTMIKMAETLLIMAGALILVSKVKWSGDLVASIFALTFVLAALTAVVVGFTKFAEGGKSKSIRAAGKTLNEMAMAFGILAIAMNILSFAKWSWSMLGSVIALGALIAELTVVLAILSNVKGATPSRLQSISKTFLSMSGVIAILALIITAISFVKWSWSMVGSVITLGALIGGIGLLLIKLSDMPNAKPSRLNAISKAFLLMAGVITILGAVIATLTKFEWNKDTFKSLVSLAVLFAAIGGLLAAISAIKLCTPKKLSTIAAAFLEMAGVIAIIGAVIVAVSKFSWNESTLGSLIAIGGALVIIGGFLVAISALKLCTPKKLRAIANAFLEMSVVIAILAYVIGAVSTIRWNKNTLGSLIAIGAMLVIIGGIFTALSALKAKTGVVLAVAAGMAIVMISLAGSLAIMANAAKQFDSVNLDNFKEAAVIFGIFIGVIAILSGVLAAFPAIGGIFVVILLAISVACIAVAGAFKLISDAVLNFSLAAINMVVALTMLGMAWQTNSEGISGAIDFLISRIPLLAAAVAEGLANMIVVLGNRAPELVSAFVSLATAIMVGFAMGIANTSGLIAIAVVKVIVDLINVLTETLPTITEAVKGLIIAVVNSVIDLTPVFIEAGIRLGMGLIGGILQGIGDAFGWNAFSDWGRSIIEQFKFGAEEAIPAATTDISAALQNKLNSIMPKADANTGAPTQMGAQGYQTGMTMGQQTSEGITSGYSEGLGGLYDSLKGALGGALGGEDGGGLVSVLSSSGFNLESLSGFTSDLTSGFAGQFGDGLSSSFGMMDLSSATEAVNGKISEIDTTESGQALGGSIITNIIGGITENSGLVPESLTGVIEDTKNTNIPNAEAAGKEVGDELDKTLSNTIESSTNKSKVKTAGTNVGKAGAEGIKGTKGEYKTAGEQVVSGAVQGVNNKISSYASACRKLAEAGNKAFKKYNEIKSPSRLFMKSGKYIVKGLVIGLERSTPSAVEAMTDMASSAYNAVNQVFSDDLDATTALTSLSDVLANIAKDEIDVNPTITPVLDLSDIQNKSSLLQQMLGDSLNTSANLAANASAYRSAQEASASNGSESGNNTTSNVTNTINVYGAEGQDVNELADAVMRRMQHAVSKKVGVFA